MSDSLEALRGRRIVLGVSGGIAAYKAVEICRRLVDAGAFVSPVLTEDALRFIGKLTFDALGSEPAQVHLWGGTNPIPHTRLGQNADLIVIAPATARVLAKYTAGLSDDLLTATLLATRAPVLVCPAMHTEMWEHPSVQENLATLRRRGVHVLDPESGRLAGGDSGAGRLADPAAVVRAAAGVLARGQDLVGKRVLVSAGGTREPIDPVRFIGNRSSGKQGYAIAAEARRRGADVVVVSTVKLPVPAGARVVAVETAAQMHDAMLTEADAADIIVMSAAVADFRPRIVADSKIKKSNGAPEVILEPTVDILAALGKTKRADQVLIGFAAETNDLIANALDKVKRKNLDLIVANDVSAPGVGFEHETNAVTILDRLGGTETVALTDKREIARHVIDRALHFAGS
jgi:phosphopantothenoylcysteine decarboxylase / phosphopantothenate---cysteine ligase